MDEMHAWTTANVAALFKGPEGRRLGWEGAFARAHRDGLTRVEFGDDVWMITQGRWATRRSSCRRHRSSPAAVSPEIEWVPQLGFSRHCTTVLAVAKWLTRVPGGCPGGWRGARRGLRRRAGPTHRGVPGRSTAPARTRGSAPQGFSVWASEEPPTMVLAGGGGSGAGRGAARHLPPPTPAAVMRFWPITPPSLWRPDPRTCSLGRGWPGVEDHPVRVLYDAGWSGAGQRRLLLCSGWAYPGEFSGRSIRRLFTAVELDQIRHWSLEV